MFVLIYNGLGASEICCRETKDTLQNLVGRFYDIRFVDEKIIASEPWEKFTRLLIFPGGKDSPFCAALKGKPLEKIKNYVFSGGAYFGICAGAYFASSQVEFEAGTCLEIIAPRDLKFFPGVAKGAAFPGYRYASEEFSRAVLIVDSFDSSHPFEESSESCDTFYQSGESFYQSPQNSNQSGENLNSETNNEFFAYFNGGCFFQNAQNYPNVKILASYQKLTKPAVILCKFGAGKAILSGIHLEINPKNKNPEQQFLKPEILPKLI
eukprot:Sdes_comp19610_c0_seq1m11351